MPTLDERVAEVFGGIMAISPEYYQEIKRCP